MRAARTTSTSAPSWTATSITAGPQSPVQFARATMSRLGLASPTLLDAYEGVFHRADPVAFAALTAA